MRGEGSREGRTETRSQREGSARGARGDRGGLREALETLVSERSVSFRAGARSQGGGFQGGGILIGIAAPGELGRSMADYGKR